MTVLSAGRKLVLGLGNPGERYRATRHNLGFEVVGELARRRGWLLEQRQCRTLVAGDASLMVGQPQTYMNRSGFALRCLVELHGFATTDVLVVYDDVALELGRLRLRPAGSPAGHRGMESVVESLRTQEVPRLRLGIAPAEQPLASEQLADFVLAPFAPGERTAVADMLARAADAAEAWIAEGIGPAMNRFN